MSRRETFTGTGRSLLFKPTKCAFIYEKEKVTLLLVDESTTFSHSFDKGLPVIYFWVFFCQSVGIHNFSGQRNSSAKPSNLSVTPELLRLTKKIEKRGKTMGSKGTELPNSQSHAFQVIITTHATENYFLKDTSIFLLFIVTHHFPVPPLAFTQCDK